MYLLKIELLLVILKESFLEIIFILESTLTHIRYLLPRECYFHYQVVPFCYMLTITVQNYFEEKKTYKAKGFYRKGANASPNAFSCFWFAIAPMPLYLTKKNRIRIFNRCLPSVHPRNANSCLVA